MRIEGTKVGGGLNDQPFQPTKSSSPPVLEENTKSTPPLLFQQSLPYPHATPLRLLQPQPLLGLSKPTQQPPHCLLAFAASDIDLNPHRISRFQHSRSLYRSRRTQLRAFGFTRPLAVAVTSNTTSNSIVASTAVIILLQVPSASSAITSREAISNAAISTQQRPASYSPPSFIISPHVCPTSVLATALSGTLTVTSAISGI